LCFSSNNSLAKKIPTVLLECVVEKGIWTPTQGLAYARYIPDVEQRAQVLVRLSRFLPEPQKSKVIQEALQIVRQSVREERQTRMLATMLPQLPERQREAVVREILLKGRAIKNEERRA